MDSYNYYTQDFVAHSSPVNCLAFGQSNQLFATGGEDKCVNLWKMGTKDNILTISNQNKASVESLCFDSDDRNVIAGCLNGSLKVFDLSTGKAARSFSTKCSVSSIHYHPHGEFFVSGSIDHTMKVWDVRHKSCIQTYNGHNKEVTCVRFSPNGQWVASSAKDGQMLFWDLVAGKLLQTVKIPSPNHITTFEFNPVDFCVAAATTGRCVKLWDLETMDCIFTTPAESCQVRAIAFSNGGTHLFSCSRDTLKVWDVDRFRLVDSFDMAWGDRIADVRVSDNCQLCAASFTSNLVNVYSVDLAESVLQTEGGVTADASAAGSASTSPVNEPPVAAAANRKESKSDMSSASSDKVRTSAPQPAPATERPRSLSDKPSGPPPASSNAVRTGGGVTRSSRLDGVSAQLSQLQSNMRGMHVAEDKHTPSAAPSTIAESAPQSKASTKDAGPPDDSITYDDDFLDPEDSFELHPAEAKRGVGEGGRMADSVFADKHSDSRGNAKGGDEDVAVVPGVVWVDGNSDIMAASLGESFRERYHIGAPSAAQGEAAEALGGGRNPNAHLEHMLPPSSYDSHPSSYQPSGGGGIKSTVQQSGQRPQQALAPVSVVRPAFDPPAAAPVVNKAPTPVFARGKVENRLMSPPTGGADKNPRVGGGGGIIRVAPADSNIFAADDEDQESSTSSVVSAKHNNRAPAGGDVGNGKAGAPVGGNSKQPAAPSTYLENKKNEDLLERLLGESSAHFSLLSSRLQGLKGLRVAWCSQDVLRVIGELGGLADGLEQTPASLTVLADFFATVDLRVASLSLDSCVRLLPVLQAMLVTRESWSAENVIFAVFHAANALCESFGELIRNTRSVVSAGGVDLNREARLLKCNDCHALFGKLRSRTDALRKQYAGKATVQDVLREFQRHANIYFN